jgi:predicted dehydrogenase
MALFAKLGTLIGQLPADPSPQDSAEAAAKHYGVPPAFCDAEKLAQHPHVDLVTVSVKVPDHYPPVMAAIEAGKHVYCDGLLAETPTRRPGCVMRQTERASATP